jgi:hypothetical protein
MRMEHSYGTFEYYPCLNCGQVFHADLWLVVDIDERPDLAKRIAEGRSTRSPAPPAVW